MQLSSLYFSIFNIAILQLISHSPNLLFSYTQLLLILLYKLQNKSNLAYLYS